MSSIFCKTIRHYYSYLQLCYKNETSCPICFGRTETLTIQSLFKNGQCCVDCEEALKWNPQECVIGGVSVTTLTVYSGIVRDIILRSKRYHLNIFNNYLFMKHPLKMLRFILGNHFLVVPNHDSNENVHLRACFRWFHIFETDMIVKNKSMLKQSRKGRAERRLIKNDISLIKPPSKRIKRLLIIDDIYTTGATIEAIVACVKPYCDSIKVLCFARTPEK